MPDAQSKVQLAKFKLESRKQTLLPPKPCA